VLGGHHRQGAALIFQVSARVDRFVLVVDDASAPAERVSTKPYFIHPHGGRNRSGRIRPSAFNRKILAVGATGECRETCKPARLPVSALASALIRRLWVSSAVGWSSHELSWLAGPKNSLIPATKLG